MGIVLPQEDRDMEAGPVTGFEGFEKRLEVEFFSRPIFSDSESRGLRALTRAELDYLLQAAQCTIVSELSNTFFDSYVLSESSLFIYPYKIVMKTCGTTKLLNAIPLLLDYASNLSLNLKFCKYTRGSFFFPLEQPYPHGSFTEEVSYLEKYFGNLGSGGKAYVMGDASRMKNWHIYSAAAPDDEAFSNIEPVYTLEMCMTGLDRRVASIFSKGTCGTASEMTQTSGISKLLPLSQICDFAFDPCGYSMNGVEGQAFSTIHITPEEGYSYASFETMGYDSHNVNLQTLVEEVVSCFRPAEFSLSLHVSGAILCWESAASWCQSVCPRGYICNCTSRQDLPGGSVLVFHTFKESERGCLHVSPLPLLQQQNAKSVHDNLLKLKKERIGCHYLSKVQHALEICDLGGVLLQDVISADPELISGSSVEDMHRIIRNHTMYSGADNAFNAMEETIFLTLPKRVMPRAQQFCAVKYNSYGVRLDKLAAPYSGDCGVFAELAKHEILSTKLNLKVELLRLLEFNQETLLQIQVFDTHEMCPVEVKNVARIHEIRHLLEAALELGVPFFVVAFHMGSEALIKLLLLLQQ